MKNATRGFTLIELLVVIAIIGILASVVLAALSSARERSRDAAIKSDMDTIRKQAAVYFNSTGNGTYGVDVNNSSACQTITTAGSLYIDSNIKSALTDIAAKQTGNLTRCAVSDAGDAYAVTARLPSTDTWWCVDSVGSAKDIGSSTPSFGSNTARCP